MHQVTTNYELIYDLICNSKLQKVIAINKAKNKCTITDNIIEAFFEKKQFVAYCIDNNLEFILPSNAEFHNDKGKLEYQIALIPFVLKRMVTWCPIVLDFTHNEMVFHYKGSDKIITQDYGDYPYFLQNELHWSNHNQETALVEALEILEYIKQQNNI